MFFLHGLRLGTALRGAIACGTVTADFQKSIFFGQPIIEAYLLEEEQAWYGLVEHSSVDRTADGETQPLGNGEIPLTVSYRVPLKSSGTVEMSAINWPVFCEDDARLDKLLSHLRNQNSVKLNSYYRLTRTFGRKMLR